MTIAAAVTVHCPECRRFMFEASDYGRAVCRDCGCEVVYRSRRRIREETPPRETVKFPLGGG